MNTWGEKLKISIFGESHGAGIGVVIDGIPSGTELDTEAISAEMERRAPGRNRLSTQRREPDSVKILSGFFCGKTTGTPLCGIIMNTNTRSGDYTPNLMRPGHADFTAIERYGMCRDYRGGGHFSGRITAPLVFAGAVAKQVLKSRGVTVGSHILSIGGIKDKSFDPVNLDADMLNRLAKLDFPVIDSKSGVKMQEIIEGHKNAKNSVGGIVECGICGVPTGVGAPFFGSAESRLSSMMFSIPAVKGIEFGAGFGFADMDGKSANDEFYVEDGAVKTYTNNNAGINGGITNGMPIVFRLVFKPTASIALTQRTVDIEKMENTTIDVHGRHDPCIVHRGAVVAEAAAAIAMLDMILE